MKILSFIIPSYNVEEYLNKALDSFLTEEAAEHLEVIVVDDGSSDGTARVAISYAERFPGIFRLLQKENGGHGSAINLGSREARGKYFKVIDADDWIITENLPAFIRYLSSCQADVVLTPFHMIDMSTGKKQFQRMYIEDYGRLYTPDEIARNWKSFDRCSTFHGITYRSAFYSEHRHELPEKVFYEDQEYATVPFCYAEKVAALDLPIYQYQVGNSQQSVAAANQIRRISHLERVIEDLLEHWQANREKPGFSNAYYQKKLEGAILSHYVIMCILNSDKRFGRKRCAKLNRKIRDICPSAYAGVRKKYHAYLLLGLLRITPKAYEKAIHSAPFRMLRHNHKIEKE